MIVEAVTYNYYHFWDQMNLDNKTPASNYPNDLETNYYEGVRTCPNDVDDTSCEAWFNPDTQCIDTSDPLCGCKNGQALEGPFCLGTEYFGADLCGDGIRSFTEQCDDQNTVDGDGCSSDCQWVELGWECHWQETGGDACFEVCGNGVVDYGEDCDDQNTDSFDGCQYDC